MEESDANAEFPDLGAEDTWVAHVSDLHLKSSDFERSGAGWRLKNKYWNALWDHLPPAVSLGIASGDFARESPDGDVYLRLKSDFRRRKDHWVVVPGNHDRRKWGNFIYDNTTFEGGFKDWKESWWNERFALVVIPIDSNPSKSDPIKAAAPWARGLVPQAELDRISTVLTKLKSAALKAIQTRISETATSPEFTNMIWYFQSAFPVKVLAALWSNGDSTEAQAILANVITDRFMARIVRCVVLHHHPMGIADTENLGLLDQDVYLTLANSGDFLQKCRNEDVSLVLHGHKHYPHRMVVGLPGLDVEWLGVVGCGSTTLLPNPSANILRIGKNGEVIATRLDLRGDIKQAEKEAEQRKLTLRSWGQVKMHLQKAAIGRSMWTAERQTIDVTVLGTGDTVITIDYVGLRGSMDVVERDKQGYFVRFPIQLRGLGAGENFVCSCTTIDSTEQHLIGQAMLEEVSQSHETSPFRGFVRIDLSNSSVPELRITFRFIRFATIATNPWQAWCEFDDPNQAERFLVRASVPVLKSLILDVQFMEPLFRSAQQLCEDPAGIVSDGESETIQLVQPQDRGRLHMSVNPPVWGVRYGVRLPLDSSSTGTIYSKATWAQTQIDRLTAVFEDRAKKYDVHITLFCIERDTGKGVRSHLKPVLHVPESTKKARNWPIGFGVAGRAAWLQQASLWVPSDKVEVDYYIPDGERHAAIFAIPIRGPAGFPTGVISFAARNKNDFANVVAVASRTRDNSHEKLNWCWTLASTIEQGLAGQPFNPE